MEGKTIESSLLTSLCLRPSLLRELVRKSLMSLVEVMVEMEVEVMGELGLLLFLTGVEVTGGDPGVGDGDTGVTEGEINDWLLPRDLSDDQEEEEWRFCVDGGLGD